MTKLLLICACIVLVPLVLLLERGWLWFIREPIEIRVSSVTLHTTANDSGASRPIKFDFFGEYSDAKTGEARPCRKYFLASQNELSSGNAALRAKLSALPGKTLQGFEAKRWGRVHAWVESDLGLMLAFTGCGLLIAAVYAALTLHTTS